MLHAHTLAARAVTANGNDCVTATATGATVALTLPSKRIGSALGFGGTLATLVWLGFKISLSQ